MEVSLSAVVNFQNQETMVLPPKDLEASANKMGEPKQTVEAVKSGRGAAPLIVTLIVSFRMQPVLFFTVTV